MSKFDMARFGRRLLADVAASNQIRRNALQMPELTLEQAADAVGALYEGPGFNAVGFFNALGLPQSLERVRRESIERKAHLPEPPVLPPSIFGASRRRGMSKRMRERLVDPSPLPKPKAASAHWPPPRPEDK